MAIPVPAVNPVSTSGDPFTPAAPGWMCARIAVLPAGKPLIVTLKSAVAEVMFPPLSLTVLIVITAVPCPPASAPVTGGVSFAVVRLTVKTVGGLVGDVADLLPHAAVPMARIAVATARRFIALLLVGYQCQG